MRVAQSWFVLMLALGCVDAEKRTDPSDPDAGTWEWVDCTEDQCVQLNIDGTAYLVLGFTDDGTRYTLASITKI